MLVGAGTVARPQVMSSGEVSSKNADLKSVADSNWESIEARRLPAGAEIREFGTAEPKTDKALEHRTHFLSLANEARNFYEQNPDHKKAATARVVEAQSLLKAQWLGDSSQQARVAELVASIRLDKSLPSSGRYEVVFMAEHLLARSLVKSRAELSTARKESGRFLINEFPAEAGGYLMLLQEADSAEDPVEVKRIADEIGASSAPFWAKAQAQIVNERYGLIGKSLADLANTALGRGNFFEQCRGRQVVLYTWGAASTRSLQYAKTLADRLPAGTLLIGFNLDRDVASAKTVAAEHALPGQQYYNEGGIGSWPALLLKLNAPSLLYLTDEHGVIRDIVGQRGELQSRLGAIQVQQ